MGEATGGEQQQHSESGHSTTLLRRTSGALPRPDRRARGRALLIDLVWSSPRAAFAFLRPYYRRTFEAWHPKEEPSNATDATEHQVGEQGAPVPGRQLCRSPSSVNPNCSRGRRCLISRTHRTSKHAPGKILSPAKYFSPILALPNPKSIFQSPPLLTIPSKIARLDTIFGTRWSGMRRFLNFKWESS